jgi:hypothetical protein
LHFFSFACLLAAAALCAGAQQAGPAANSALASIQGVVASTEGDVYQGARIVLERGVSDAQETQQTDADGHFHFANLQPGAFKITISAEGFVSQSVVGLLRPGEAFDARTIALPVASSDSVVRVSAESQVELAQQQLNIEEKQRVLGVFPNYYVSYDHEAAPLTAHQKFQLAWKTSIDPITWMMTGVVAGVEQASNTFSGYGQGAEGYGKRFGANYADSISSAMIGGALLPSLFRQDPRYFYKGTGSVSSRARYAIASAFICKGDNRRWQFNYSGILGGIAAGGISNLYYPSSSRNGVEETFENSALGTAGSAVQNLLQEFVVRRLTPRLPHRAPAIPNQ